MLPFSSPRASAEALSLFPFFSILLLFVLAPSCCVGSHGALPRIISLRCRFPIHPFFCSLTHSDLPLSILPFAKRQRWILFLLRRPAEGHFAGKSAFYSPDHIQYLVFLGHPSPCQLARPAPGSGTIPGSTIGHCHSIYPAIRGNTVLGVHSGLQQTISVPLHVKHLKIPHLRAARAR